MTEASAVAALATLLADHSRAAMCLAMLDGRAWTAGELAAVAGVGAPGASEHLTRLVAAGLVVEERTGRHRYVRLAGPEVATLVEDLSAYASPETVPRQNRTSMREVRVRNQLAAARTCYDHLAGRLGVALLDAMAARGLVDLEYGVSVTASGTKWLARLDAPPSPPSRRSPARLCLDWTERRPHLAGAAGAAVLAAALDHSWLERLPATRAVRVTAPGARAFDDLLGIDTAIVTGRRVRR